MSVILRTLFIVLMLLITAGCAQAPKQLYMWEQFPRIQYEYLVGKGESIENQIQLLEAHAEKARAANAALPPGFRAHFGMLYLANGNSIAAQQMWRSEKVAFPESVVYMDTLLKRLNKSTPSKAGVTEK